ncbi:uncharacterized protein LOC130558742 [Triplophysa rosa]|uniref:uncharacterized protein LOC130558742 n=1 Tax=Triplophysa rosa TaxID=992332 RepID=UPI0025461FD4|nr:uncharacterized protein LOC130558742 [Triplophysa rosa]
MQEINSCMYVVGEMLAKTAFVTVYAGTRAQDGAEVALKYVHTTRHVDYISIPNHPEPLPREVALQMIACEDSDVPEIAQLLDWKDYLDHYVMVVERPFPCQGLDKFVASQGGKLDEELAKRFMWQATLAACMCLVHGVFHRNVTLENFLVKTDTMGIRLIGFRCGDLFKRSTYKTFTGTRDYICPEFFQTGEYYAKPATVYSLGVLLFAMLCGRFPNRNELVSIKNRSWYNGDLTFECCHLIEDCLQEDPEKRIDLEDIFDHKWFEGKYHTEDIQIPDDDESRVFNRKINGRQYEIGGKLGRGGFGTVYKGIRVNDGLKVAVKFVKNDQDEIYIPGYRDPLPREVALHMLACAGGFVPVIAQFLDWQNYQDHYVMVLEHPCPCMDVAAFVEQNGGTLPENIARVILSRAAEAAEVCCNRGVFHRDIKLENLLINRKTLEVKLIDFGCGDLLKSSSYNEYMGTPFYTCPEYLEQGKYHGKPATVYSLGVLLFFMLCGDFPGDSDRQLILEGIWHRRGLTQECCSFVEDCLQRDPKKRIDLEMIRNHKWFQVKYPADAETHVHFGRHDVIQHPYYAGSEINDHVDILENQPEEKLEDDKECRVVIREIHDQLYGIGRKLGQGICEGIRLQDCLKVTVKFVKKTEDVIKDYIYIPGWPNPFPREVGLQLLASEGGNVPMIIKLLDWQDYPEEYIMVLECPSHCVDVGAFLHSNGGTVPEYIAQAILGQAAEAAQLCCKRGVFHGDIKLENLLINPNTLEVKLMAFGCGNLLKSSTYNKYMGMFYHFPL